MYENFKQLIEELFSTPFVIVYFVMSMCFTVTGLIKRHNGMIASGALFCVLGLVFLTMSVSASIYSFGGISLPVITPLVVYGAVITFAYFTESSRTSRG